MSNITRFTLQSMPELREVAVGALATRGKGGSTGGENLVKCSSHRFRSACGPRDKTSRLSGGL